MEIYHTFIKYLTTLQYKLNHFISASIKDVNDDINSAEKLVKLLNGIPSKVNLIYFNPYPGTDFKRPDVDTMKKFQNYLINKGIMCTIRKSKGMDISAACGQLREKELRSING